MNILASWLFSLLLTPTLIHGVTDEKAAKGAVLLKDVTLIDGNGGPAQTHIDILIQGDSIAAIGKRLSTKNVTVLNMSGKTVMPTLLNSHVHVGALKGNSTIPANYTKENVLRQLKKYQDYGIGAVLSMGSDRPFIFETGLLDSSKNGQLPGARMLSAGYGFGVPKGAPPIELAMDRVFRPSSAAQVAIEMDSLAALKPEMVKMWVDDFGCRFEKMDPVIYKAVIEQAHKHNLRAIAHAFYMKDAHQLLEDGIDIFGHSLRETVIEDDLVALIKQKNVVYIPTLSLYAFNVIYAQSPDFINDPFFKSACEPGVYEMVTSEKYKNEVLNAPAYKGNVIALENALKNLKKVYDAGILVSFGTDSGATPIRAQGFAEHLELELMVRAGLTPAQVIQIATKNTAEVLKIGNQYGTLAKGKKADLLVLDANPLENIKNTRKISAVYKAGKEVSKGPVEAR